jgi:hypothetical protein
VIRGLLLEAALSDRKDIKKRLKKARNELKALLHQEQANIAHLEAIRAVEREAITEPTFPGSFRDKEQFRSIRAMAMALDIDEKWKKRVMTGWLGSLYKLPSDADPRNALQALHKEMDLWRADYGNPTFPEQRKKKQEEGDHLASLLYATKGLRVSRLGAFFSKLISFLKGSP